MESRAFEWAPLSVSRRRSRGLRKTPQWGAERRAGPRYGPAVPSRWRDRLSRKAGQWVGVPAREFRRSATLCWRMRRVRNRQFGRKPAGMRRAATLPHGSTQARRNDDADTALPKRTRSWFWQNEPERSNRFNRRWPTRRTSRPHQDAPHRVSICRAAASSARRLAPIGVIHVGCLGQS